MKIKLKFSEKWELIKVPEILLSTYDYGDEYFIACVNYVLYDYCG